MKAKRHSLTSSLFRLTVVPLLCLGVSSVLIAAFSIYNATTQETRDGLADLAHSLYRSCTLVSDGDFTVTGDELYKGGVPLSTQSFLVDDIKSVSGTDATVFCADRRVLTSISDNQGGRAVGTLAAPEVAETVLTQGADYFSDRVSVNGTPYYGYYMPLRNARGGIVGMVFVGKARDTVTRTIALAVLQIFIVVTAILTAAAAVALRYAKKTILSLNKIKNFLKETADGKLESTLDPALLKREDELGDMGRFTVRLQKSITELIGADPLTGLYNRRSGEVLLENLLENYQKSQTVFSVAMGDIDFFKQINDQYGHLAGDAVLKELAALFTRHVERRGYVFRWGGEEFLFVFENIAKEDVSRLLEELLDAICGFSVLYEGREISLAMTFGVTDCTMAQTVEKLIETADISLYHGKNNGKNQVVTC
ncbi:MAG: diguanylate cyclase [Oscillospiraceae bacterium]|nr:diguanylate cyclase [Oscillospiraceae bacterium]